MEHNYHPLDLQTLLDMHAAQQEEYKRYNLSVQLGFCPTCGAKIVNFKEVTSKRRNFLWFFEWKTTKIDKGQQCSMNSDHYKQIHYYNEGTWDY